MEDPEMEAKQKALFDILEREVGVPDAKAVRIRAENLFVSALEMAVNTVIETMANSHKPELRLRAALSIIDRGLGRLAPSEASKAGADDSLRSFVGDVTYER